MKIDASRPAHWALLLQQGLYTLMAIVARIFIKKPEKPIVLLYGHQLSGNLKALYSEWEQQHQDKVTLYFLSLDPHYSDKLLAMGIRVLKCNKPADMLNLARASAMITDHGLHLMTPLMAFTDIVFIDVWHGIPFKGFIPEDLKLQHRYDEVWVSSPLLEEIYVDKFGFKRDRVYSLGYARTDKLFRRQKPSTALAGKLSNSGDEKYVLYAPTWQQDDQGRELFPFGETRESFIKGVSQICSAHDATLLIRSHLNSEINEIPHTCVRYCSQKDYPDTEDLLLLSDILICDWSSIAFDYLTLDRPTIFLDIPPPFKNGLTLDTNYRFGCVTANMESLCQMLATYLDQPDDYLRRYGRLLEKVKAEVYADNLDGLTADRQLKRLVDLTHDTGRQI